MFEKSFNQERIDRYTSIDIPFSTLYTRSSFLRGKDRARRGQPVMRTQSRDTHPEAERVLIDLIRKAPIAKRFGLVRSTTASLLKANLRDIEKSFPDVSPREIALQFLLRSRQRQWQTMTEALEITLRNRRNWHIGNPDMLLVLRSIADILEKQHITYYIGGSLASSLYGMQQLAQDIDLVVASASFQISALIADMRLDYLIDETAIYNAVRNHTSFSMLHLETLLKVDVIIPQDNLFEQQANQRRQWHTLDKDSRLFPVSSPEDIVLVKLKHHQQTGTVPDDQWNDILGVLKVQGPHVNLTYMKQWAGHLNITNLLKQAGDDAGLKV
jgi:hypothetical protein